MDEEKKSVDKSKDKEKAEKKEGEQAPKKSSQSTWLVLGIIVIVAIFFIL